MKTKCLIWWFALTMCGAISLEAQTTAFTYQGRLNDGASPAEGAYDLRFTLYDAPSEGTVVMGSLTIPLVNVKEGLFTERLDFGATAFSGADRWLEISVRTNGAATFVTLSPRQLIAPSPYAIYSASAASLAATGTQALEFKLDGMRALRIEPHGTETPSLIGGHFDNSASNFVGSVVVGGGALFRPNVTTGDYAFIGGGLNNSAAAYASVAGGYDNSATGDYSTIAGGSGNRATGLLATVAGGGGFDSGQRNTASGVQSTVGGGTGNSATNAGATAAGGFNNRANGRVSFIGGGGANVALGIASMAPGGLENAAEGSYSFAAGRRAKAKHDGAFVWADGTGADFESTTDNQFSIRAAGGFRLEGDQASAFFTSLNHQNGSVLTLRNLSDAPFYLGAINFANKDDVVGQIAYLANHSMKFSLNGGGGMIIDGSGTFTVSSPSQGSAQFTVDANANLNFGAQTRQMLNLWNAEYGIGVQSSTEYFRSGNTFSWFRGGVHNDGFRNPGEGVEQMVLDFFGNLNIRGAFGSLSDRNAKEDFEVVNGREVLDKVAALPISKWNYKGDCESRHIGPMAQDFYAAFGLGSDDKHITTVDADGVALAAIKGLNAKLEENVQKLEAENIELKARLEKLELLIGKLNIQ